MGEAAKNDIVRLLPAVVDPDGSLDVFVDGARVEWSIVVGIGGEFRRGSTTPRFYSDEDRPLRDQRLGGALLEGLMAHAHGAPRRHDGGPSCDEAPTSLPDAPLCPRPPACPDVPPDVPLCFPDAPPCPDILDTSTCPDILDVVVDGARAEWSIVVGIRRPFRRGSTTVRAHSDEDRPLRTPISRGSTTARRPGTPTCAPGHAD